MTSTETPDRPRDGALPGYVVVTLGVVLTLAALFLMHEFRGIVAPVFFALNLIIAAYPVHRWLVGKGAPAWLAAAVMALTVIVILLVLIAALVGIINALVGELPKYSGQYLTVYNAVKTYLAGLNINIDNIGLSDILAKVNPTTVTGAITAVYSSASGILGVVAVIAASLVFFAMDAPSVAKRLRIVGIVHPPMGRSFEDFTHGVRRYWIVTTVFGLIVAVLDGVALAILGVPLPVTWAVLSFITNYIPTVGFVVGVVPPALLGLFLGGWQLAVAVVAVYTVLNVVIQVIIQPRFTGESVGVSVTVSFVSLLLWGWVLGPLGTLLALPTTLLVKALLIDVDPKARWVAALISSRPDHVLTTPEEDDDDDS